MPPRAQLLLDLALAKYQGAVCKSTRPLPVSKSIERRRETCRVLPRSPAESVNTKCNNWINKCQLSQSTKPVTTVNPSFKRKLSFSSAGKTTESLKKFCSKKSRQEVQQLRQPEKFISTLALPKASFRDSIQPQYIMPENPTQLRTDSPAEEMAGIIVSSASLRDGKGSSPIPLSANASAHDEVQINNSRFLDCINESTTSAVIETRKTRADCLQHNQLTTCKRQLSFSIQDQNEYSGKNATCTVGSSLPKANTVNKPMMNSLQHEQLKTCRRRLPFRNEDQSLGAKGTYMVASNLPVGNTVRMGVMDSSQCNQLSASNEQLPRPVEDQNDSLGENAISIVVSNLPVSNAMNKTDIVLGQQIYKISGDGELVPADDILPFMDPNCEQTAEHDFEVVFPETALEQILVTENQVITAETTPTGRGRIADRNIVPAAPLKKVKDPSVWKVNDAKKKRHSGDAYTSKEGKQYPAKVMRPSCGPSCRFQCDMKVSEGDRLYFKERYYTRTENQTQKWMFIWKYVVSNPTNAVKGKKHGEDNEDDVGCENDADSSKKKSSRSCQNQYFMELKDQTQVKVCKEMFKNTLVISDGTIATALKKRGSPDKRGKVGVKRVVPELLIQSVHDHIKLFPRVSSHYCRKDTTYEYLEENVESTANMYRQYVTWMDEHHQNNCKATKRHYEEEVNKLKIKIFKPRKDRCDVCYAYESLPKELQEDQDRLQQYNNHIMNKDLAQALYMEKRTAHIGNQSVVVASVDLQKVLLLPHCRAGAAYYKRKLSVLNFTVKEIRGNRNSQGFCYVWHEAIAKRGANEIASCLYMYMVKRIEDGVKTFRFWSDNCSSQNKNRFLFGMYLCVAAKYNVKIFHSYLEKGHTHNDADGIHSTIERKTSKMEMFVPEDWFTVMEKVKVTGNPYIVTRMTQEDIFDFHYFVVNRTNWTRAENGEHVRWSEIHEISFDGAQPWILNVKYNHGDKDVPVRIRNKAAGHPINLANVEYQKAYSSPLPVPRNKLRDLQDLIDSGIIPHRARPFYAQLTPGEQEDEYYAPLN